MDGGFLVHGYCYQFISDIVDDNMVEGIQEEKAIQNL